MKLHVQGRGYHDQVVAWSLEPVMTVMRDGFAGNHHQVLHARLLREHCTPILVAGEVGPRCQVERGARMALVGAEARRDHAAAVGDTEVEQRGAWDALLVKPAHELLDALLQGPCHCGGVAAALRICRELAHKEGEGVLRVSCAPYHVKTVLGQ